MVNKKYKELKNKLWFVYKLDYYRAIKNEWIRVASINIGILKTSVETNLKNQVVEGSTHRDIICLIAPGEEGGEG